MTTIPMNVQHRSVKAEACIDPLCGYELSGSSILRTTVGHSCRQEPACIKVDFCGCTPYSRMFGCPANTTLTEAQSCMYRWS